MKIKKKYIIIIYLTIDVDNTEDSENMPLDSHRVLSSYTVTLP